MYSLLLGVLVQVTRVELRAKDMIQSKVLLGTLLRNTLGTWGTLLRNTLGTLMGTP
jgi:hypothetical protein